MTPSTIRALRELLTAEEYIALIDAQNRSADFTGRPRYSMPPAPFPVRMAFWEIVSTEVWS